VSLQLRALAQAGLVDTARRQTEPLLPARREALGPLGAMLERMWDDALWKLKLWPNWSRRAVAQSRGAGERDDRGLTPKVADRR